MRDPLFVNSKPLVIHSSFIHLKPIILSKGRYVKRNLEVSLKVFEKQLAHAASLSDKKNFLTFLCSIFHDGLQFYNSIRAWALFILRKTSYLIQFSIFCMAAKLSTSAGILRTFP